MWDLRNPGNQLAQLHRPVYTNQRIYFDLYRQAMSQLKIGQWYIDFGDSALSLLYIYHRGHYLLSGSADGQVLAWDTSDLDPPSPLLSHAAHNDPVTGCR